MTTIAELVREYVPDAKDDDVSNIMFNFTAFPAGTEEVWRRQLGEFAAANAAGLFVCFCCGRAVAEVDDLGWCPACEAVSE